MLFGKLLGFTIHVEYGASVWYLDLSELHCGWFACCTDVFYSYREVRVVPDRRERFWWKSEFGSCGLSIDSVDVHDGRTQFWTGVSCVYRGVR